MPRPWVMIDFETRSRVNLKQVGASRYAKDPSTEALCMSWRSSDGQSGLWTYRDPERTTPHGLMGVQGSGMCGLTTFGSRETYGIT